MVNSQCLSSFPLSYWFLEPIPGVPHILLTAFFFKSSQYCSGAHRPPPPPVLHTKPSKMGTSGNFNKFARPIQSEGISFNFPFVYHVLLPTTPMFSYKLLSKYHKSQDTPPSFSSYSTIPDQVDLLSADLQWTLIIVITSSDVSNGITLRLSSLNSTHTVALGPLK